MIRLVFVQIVAGALAGWALEYLLRTQPQRASFGIRWRALGGAAAGLTGYAYVVGVIVDDRELSDVAMFVGAAVLLVATVSAYAISRNRNR